LQLVNQKIQYLALTKNDDFRKNAISIKASLPVNSLQTYAYQKMKNQTRGMFNRSKSCIFTQENYWQNPID